jgi:hypothetical protein
MTEDLGGGYLSGLPEDQRDELAAVNGPGLAALREYLASGVAVAFLGAGASRPLYPLWDGLIGELVDAAADQLTSKEATTCRVLARQSPEAVVEIVRRGLGPGMYRDVLRQVLRVQTDPESGRSWTPVQELVCRCPFKAVVTTNYDPGIVDARMRVRPHVSATGFMTWEDELGLDRWRTGDVFGDAELPVLFAHGQHNRPDSVVLATTEYRRAYAGKLPHVLARLMDGHLVWIGFSFADQWVAAILREIAEQTGTRIDPGGPPRHIAVMAWDPVGAGNDPRILAQRAEIEYGAQVVLYPARGGDHSALARFLSGLTDPRFPAVAELPARAERPGTGPRVLADRHTPGIPAAWVSTAEPVAHFTGRTEELARLDRWAADPQVSLVGVTAWGGAGKTALVTHWAQEAGGATRRPGIRGVFGWNFYADPSAENWARTLLEWVRQNLGGNADNATRAALAVLGVLRDVPLLLVLDGLEVAQEGPAGSGFGRLLDGTLREVLAGACQLRHGGLVVLTSRFPFADLETFDGGSARMLDVPRFTPAEGSSLLAAAGGGWLADQERRALVRAVDGHALATGVLARLLAVHPPASDLAALREELGTAARTDARVSRVLKFYRARLSEPDRYLLAAVSLFSRPVETAAVLAVAGHEAFESRLAGWTPTLVEEAVEIRLAGLANWHPDGTISAHPLVRDSFRPLVMAAAGTAAEITLAGLPAGKVTTRADALRVVEAIELLLDAGQWQAADDMHRNRCSDGVVWRHLPAARLGQRAATAFVATHARRAACKDNLGFRRLGFYLNAVGLFAMYAGDLTTARDYLVPSNDRDRDAGEVRNLAIRLTNLTECLGHLGLTSPARERASQALSHAEKSRNQTHTCYAHAVMGWVAGLVGDAEEAERNFIDADRVEVTYGPRGDHLYSLRGIWWAEWLSRTGRPGPARALTSRNADISRGFGWNADVARCDRLLGRLALAAGDTVTAEVHLTAAAAAFRAGDYLVDLAITLADLANWAQAGGDLGAAERYAAEAINIAAPRGLISARSAALAVRAQARARQAASNGSDPDSLAQGRDAADAAQRLAARHHLAWHELDALRAHAALDQAEGRDRGWAAKADVLHVRLVPVGLDPDPLATVARLVVEEKAEQAARSQRPAPRRSEADN